MAQSTNQSPRRAFGDRSPPGPLSGIGFLLLQERKGHLTDKPQVSPQALTISQLSRSLAANGKCSLLLLTHTILVFHNTCLPQMAIRFKMLVESHNHLHLQQHITGQVAACQYPLCWAQNSIGHLAITFQHQRLPTNRSLRTHFQKCPLHNTLSNLAQESIRTSRDRRHPIEWAYRTLLGRDHIDLGPAA